MNDLHKIGDNVVSKDDFVRFLQAMCANLKESPQAWQNCDLWDFLEAMSACIADRGPGRGVSEVGTSTELTWNQLAWEFVTATIYD